MVVLGQQAIIQQILQMLISYGQQLNKKYNEKYL